MSLKIDKLTDKVELNDVQAEGWIDGDCNADCWTIVQWTYESSANKLPGCYATYDWTQKTTSMW